MAILRVIFVMLVSLSISVKVLEAQVQQSEPFSIVHPQARTVFTPGESISVDWSMSQRGVQPEKDALGLFSTVDGVCTLVSTTTLCGGCADNMSAVYSSTSVTPDINETTTSRATTESPWLFLSGILNGSVSVKIPPQTPVGMFYMVALVSDLGVISQEVCQILLYHS